DVVSPEFINL
ncbi:hypothetical protein MIMGU_mgv1a0245132mg, partial [Erythranthe guttata]